MLTLLEATTGTLLLITILTCLRVKCLSSENDELYKGIERLEAELEQVRAKQRVFEKRFQKMAEPTDKIAIVHEHKYSDINAPKYPNSEGL